jgi:hypothetical protein
MTSFVNVKEHEEKDLFIHTYKKKAFYKKHWTEETINARGHVYNREGNLLSCPFPKFFNMDETKLTSRSAWVERIKEHPSNIILDTKWNGHLSILFNDGDEWINTTKGSFDHEWIGADRDLIEKAGFTDAVLECLPPEWTFMFEIISYYDPHLMTSRYMQTGGDRAVLIGVNDRISQLPVERSLLIAACDEMGIKAPSDYTTIEEVMETIKTDDPGVVIDYLFGLQDTEGFILHDLTDHFRVKIKTDWFVKNRYLYQFGHDKTKKIFLEHYDSDTAYEIIPEELYDAYETIMDDCEEFLDAAYCSLMEILQVGFASYKTKEATYAWVKQHGQLHHRDKESLLMYAEGDDNLDYYLRESFAESYGDLSLVKDL